uniref:Uncharacterized protein n=1 Tax=Rhizophora mucronata TaxID=61149 RepID=A0A2P2PD64_RHIMU
MERSLTHFPCPCFQVTKDSKTAFILRVNGFSKCGIWLLLMETPTLLHNKGAELYPNTSLHSVES